MLAHRHVVAVARQRRPLPRADHRRILAVGEDDERRLGEQPLQRFGAIDEHIARGRAHERLDAARLVRFERANLLDVAVGRAKMKTVITRAAACRRSVLVPERLARRRLRTDIRHVHEAGDAACRRRRRLGREVPLVRQARLAEVHLIVDHPGHQNRALGVDDPHAGGRGDIGGHFLDALTANQYVTLGRGRFVDQPRVLYQRRFHVADTIRGADAYYPAFAAGLSRFCRLGPRVR